MLNKPDKLRNCSSIVSGALRSLYFGVYIEDAYYELSEPPSYDVGNSKQNFIIS